ncbi:hypothetical protein [Halococcus sp. PRR34]|uniref:hypothetical protein n=1 Tax=Halococcus sp. PRR34 TaxID=3020830 RepID=UPI00235F3379|nr:hypothetical protein [Halococcus sp. PRR34]
MVVTPALDVTQVEVVDHDMLGSIGEQLTEYPEGFAAERPELEMAIGVLFAETVDTLIVVALCELDDSGDLGLVFQVLITDRPDLMIGFVSEVTHPVEWDRLVLRMGIYIDRPVAVEREHHHGYCPVS